MSVSPFRVIIPARYACEVDEYRNYVLTRRTIEESAARSRPAEAVGGGVR